MNHPLGKRHAPEVEAEEVTQELIVIADKVGDLGLLAVQAEHLLDDRVGVGVPPPPAAQLPAIDDVPDEVEMVALDRLEERQEGLGLAVSAPQVEV